MNAPTRVLERPVPIEPYWRRVPGADTLLQAIALNPEDDTAHLALADLCEEHGETRRAEFVRLAVDPARCDLSREEAAARSAELLASHGDDWCRGLPVVPGVVWRDAAHFVRGVLCAVSFREAPTDADAAAVLAAVDVRCVRLGAVDFPIRGGLAAMLRSADEVSFQDGDHLRAVLATVAANRVRRVFVRIVRSEVAFGRAFAETPASRSLDELGVSEGNSLSIHAVGPLLSAPLLRRLRRLSLVRCGIGPVAARRIAEWEGCRSLTSLDLTGNRLFNVGAEALAASPNLSGLRELRLGDCGIGDVGATALAGSASLSAVGAVVLSKNHIGPAAAAAFGPRLFEGDALDLDTAMIGDAGIPTLLGAWADRTCRRLNVAGCGLTAAGVSELTDHPGLASVADLSLDGNRFGTAGVAALCRSPYLGRLRRLSLNRIRWDAPDGDRWHWPEGLRELALSAAEDLPALCEVLESVTLPTGLRAASLTESNPTTDQLRRFLAALPVGLESLSLSLSARRSSDAVAAVVAAAPNLSSLRELDVSGCRLSGAGVAALLASPHFGELVRLDASGHSLTADEIRAVARETCPPSLRTLVLNARAMAADAVAELRAAPAFRGVASMVVQSGGP